MKNTNGNFFSTHIRHFFASPLPLAIILLPSSMVPSALFAVLVAGVGCAVNLSLIHLPAAIAAVVLSPVMSSANEKYPAASTTTQLKCYDLFVHPSSRMDKKWTIVRS